MPAYQIAEILGVMLALVCIASIARPLVRALRRYVESAIEEYRQRLEADARADALLREIVTPAEYRRIEDTGYLEVHSQVSLSRLYRIPAHGGLVGMYEDGELVAGLCIQPATRLPGPDLVAMHKLMIEGNEEEYLRTANHLRPWMFYSTRRRHPAG
jgi:hypothetical protein